MRLIDGIRIIERKRLADSRGWFLKVIDGKEENLPERTGEFYLTQAEPGQVRGNHYHPLASEWFTVVQGQATAHLRDPETGDLLKLFLSHETPQTLFVPAGLGHLFVNESSKDPFLLVAYSDRLYTPDDTIPLDVLCLTP